MRAIRQAPAQGQNSIDYITYHNKDGVSDLLEHYGYVAPKHPRALVSAVKALIQKKGEKAIKALLELHPDKNAILQLSTSSAKTICDACSNDSYDSATNFCKACGHSKYSGIGDEANFLKQFKTYDIQALERYYQSIVKQSNVKPQDKHLAREVQMVWNEIRTRKIATKTEDQNQVPKDKALRLKRDELLLFGAVFVAGLLVGHGLKLNRTNVR